jgi:hypothetical protein
VLLIEPPIFWLRQHGTFALRSETNPHVQLIFFFKSVKWKLMSGHLTTTVMFEVLYQNDSAFELFILVSHFKTLFPVASTIDKAVRMQGICKKHSTILGEMVWKLAMAALTWTSFVVFEIMYYVFSWPRGTSYSIESWCYERIVTYTIVSHSGWKMPPVLARHVIATLPYTIAWLEVMSSLQVSQRLREMQEDETTQELASEPDGETSRSPDYSSEEDKVMPSRTTGPKTTRPTTIRILFTLY